MAHFTRARRMGRDEEAGREEIREMLDDPDVPACCAARRSWRHLILTSATAKALK